MTIKSLTILDIDLIDSNEAILVLNNLPNVQILNGKSTRDEEEEEYEEEERDFNNNNVGTGKKLYSKMEEIKEDKNMENNSNYNSSENNTMSNQISSRSAKIPNIITNNNNPINNDNNYKKEISDKNSNIIKEQNFQNIKPNTFLYDKIISDDSNKKIISNSESSTNREINDIQKKTNSLYFPKFKIDITNEELNLLNEGKNKFPLFLQEFNELFPKKEEITIINKYNNKIKDIENKKGTIPNYYLFYLIIKKKASILKNLFDEMFPFILNNCPELNKNDIFLKLYTEVLNIIFSSKQLMLSLHNHIEQFNIKNSIDNQEENNYNIELNKIISENNKTISKMKSEKNNLLKKFNDYKSRYELKINTLEKENEFMANKLLNNLNSNFISPYTTLNSKTNKINFSFNISHENKYKSRTPKRSDEKENYKSMPEIENNKNNKSPNKSIQTTLSVDNNIYLHTYNCSSSINRRQTLSLKGLKEFINELYISKSNYNKKCAQLKLPNETLEEYMYTYLYKKFGLKTIVIDWARNVIQGIKDYSKKDSMVLLFGKILKNEQEEDAQYILKTVLKNIQELLKFYLKKQNPLKSIAEVEAIFEMKKRSELFEEEWKGIIYSIFEQKEAEEIQKKIENFIDKEKQKKKSEMIQEYKNLRISMYKKYANNIGNLNTIKNENSLYLNTINSFNNGLNNISFHNNSLSSPKNISVRNNIKMTRTEKYNMLLIPDDKNILYDDFIRIVLNSHIRFRDRQLKNFVELFKSVDIDRDGVINEDEFAELIQKMKIFKEEEIENKIFYFLEKIDPFDNQKITFSECINFFSGELITEIDDNKHQYKISVLEKIFFNDETKEAHKTENIIDSNNEKININEQNMIPETSK